MNERLVEIWQQAEAIEPADQRVQIEPCPAADVRPGMLLFVQGYLFVIVETKADGDRQLSDPIWSGVGPDPSPRYRQMSHGLKYGYDEWVIRSENAPPDLRQIAEPIVAWHDNRVDHELE